MAELNTAADATKAGTPSVIQLEREGVLLYLAFQEAMKKSEVHF